MVSATITGTAKAASNDVGFNTGSVKSDKVGSFGSIMAKSLGSNAAAGNSVSEKTSVAGAMKSSDNKTDKSEASKSSVNDSTGKIDDVKTDGTKDSNVGKTDKTDTAEVADNTQIDDEFEAEAKEAAESVLDKIKEVLDISDEELEKCMELLGLSMLDLLEADNVIKLVMEVTGAEDVMQLVTDSDLSAALKDIMNYLSQVTDELTTEFDMSSEEFSDMLDRVSDNVNQAEAETVNEAVDMTVETQKEAEAVHKDAAASKTVAERETEAPETLEDVVASKVTVERESKAAGTSSDNTKEQMQGKANTQDGVNPGVGQSNVVQQISQTFEAVFADTHDVNAADVVRQVVDAIKLTGTRVMQSMEIQLNPENLGKVNILVSVREGVVTAQIATQNEQVKRALEGQLSTLKENFENQGIKVDAVEVTVQSHAFDGNAQFGDRQHQESAGKSKRRINLEDLNYDDEQPEEEENIIANANSSVEYMA